MPKEHGVSFTYDVSKSCRNSTLNAFQCLFFSPVRAFPFFKLLYQLSLTFSLSLFLFFSLSSFPQLRTKLAQMDISLFRNMEKHTLINPSAWIPEDPEPVTVPVNQELKMQVSELHKQVSELAANVRTMRREVVSNVQVTSLTEQLGAEGSDMMMMMMQGSDSGASTSGTTPDLVTRDMLKRLKTNVDTLVTTTESLRRDVPQCLAVSQRELHAATQVLKDTSNVDHAMARSGSSFSSSSSSSSSQHQGLRELASTPRGAIRGLLAAEHSAGYGNTSSFEL
jgi:hypothetical protein